MSKMNFSEVLEYTNKMEDIIFSTNHTKNNDFFDYWNNLQNNFYLFNETAFLRLVATSIVVFESENKVINDFISQELIKKHDAKLVNEINDNLNDEILWMGFKHYKINFIENYFPKDFDFNDISLKIIKYSNYQGLNWFIEHHVPEKKQAKFLQFAQKECFDYLLNGYSYFDTLSFISEHPKFKPQQLKQTFYNLVLNEKPILLQQVLNNEKLMTCFNEINSEHYYKLFINKIIELEKDGEHNDLLNSFKETLINSYQIIPFDFLNNSISKQINKYPELRKIVDSFSLKEKLEYLDEKPNVKKHKI